MNYKVISALSLFELEKRVNDQYKKGYTPIGSVTILRNTNGDNWFYQPIKKDFFSLFRQMYCILK